MVSIFPMEYTIPSVETMTSLVANPPSWAIFVHPLKPEYQDMDSNASPSLTAFEFLSDSSDRMPSIIESCALNSAAGAERFAFFASAPAMMC